MSRLSSRHHDEHVAATTGRYLKTGSETLRALQLLGSSPDGLAPDELAGRLGKSKSTARYLLNTLCQEGYAFRDGSSGVYRLAEAPPWGCPWGHRGNDADGVAAQLSDALTEVYRRTRQRAYLARVEDDRVVVLDIRGRQGLPKIPGLAESIPAEQAHALAVSKALAALSTGYRDTVEHEGTFEQFTHATVTGRHAFDHELELVRQSGFALDREEFAEGFCCIASPVLNPDGQVAASLALSVPARRFETDCIPLINDVVEVAAAASEQWRRSVHPDTGNGARTGDLAAGDGDPTRVAPPTMFARSRPPGSREHAAPTGGTSKPDM
ncbi:MAG: helix-turn-helix domain-containing protein [Pseudonocardiaceae bacterium]|nr:helix-turn-helix domain-containing protein [Pseudonocardiaceae bacterium]